MACVCQPRTWEVEAGGSVIQRHLQLYRDSRSSLGHKIPSQEEDGEEEEEQEQEQENI